MKIEIGTNVNVYPMPVVLVGSNVRSRPNFMPVGWVSRVNPRPPMIAVSINKRRYTPQGIKENRAFSVNFPDLSLIEETDYCGIVSGHKTDKSGLFDVFYGELETAPMIKQCPLCLECRLHDIISLPINNLFIGAIKGAYAEEHCLTEGNPDVTKMKSFVLTMPDNNYWILGEKAGRALNIGLKLKQ